jgi:hypothetical protein
MPAAVTAPPPSIVAATAAASAMTAAESPRSVSAAVASSTSSGPSPPAPAIAPSSSSSLPPPPSTSSGVNGASGDDLGDNSDEVKVYNNEGEADEDGPPEKIHSELQEEKSSLIIESEKVQQTRITFDTVSATIEPLIFEFIS